MDLYRPPEGVWQGGDDKQKQDGTEEEKKLQAKYELLRKKRVRFVLFCLHELRHASM